MRLTEANGRAEEGSTGWQMPWEGKRVPFAALEDFTRSLSSLLAANVPLSRALTILYKERKVSFNRFKRLLSATDGALYTHMQKLIQAGYVRDRKEIAGNIVQTVYLLTEPGKKLFKRYLTFLENFISEGGRV